NARSRQGLLEAAEGFGHSPRFLGVPGDIAEPETAGRLFGQAIERFGQVDILVNNAGIFIAKPFTEYSGEDLEALVDTNLKGVIYATRAAARHMMPRRCGHILNVTASIALQPLLDVPAVLPVLIKGGLNQATRAL